MTIRLRGRQNAHANLGVDVMNRFYEMIKDFGTLEKKPLLEGRNIWMMVVPVKA